LGEKVLEIGFTMNFSNSKVRRRGFFYHVYFLIVLLFSEYIISTVAYARGVKVGADDDQIVEKKLSQRVILKVQENYSQCKDGKVGCVGIPEGCVEKFLEDSKTVCTVMLSWSSPDGIRNSYLLSGNSGNTSGGFVAMAFSDDQDMVRIQMNSQSYIVNS